MAKEELEFNIKVNAGDSVKELETVKSSLEGIEDELRNVKKATRGDVAAAQFKKLNAVVDESVLSIQELGTAADNYKNIALAAGKESPIGKQALQRAAALEQQLTETQQSVANLSEKGKGLQASLQLAGTVTAGYTAFQSVTALVGEENEDLVKSLVKVQGAMGLLVSIEQIRASLEKQSILRQKAQAIGSFLLAKGTLVYAAAQKIATIGTKSFGKALIGTGIGAIVVGIGLLIANLDSVGKFFKWIGDQIYQYFKPPIDLVIDALQWLGIVESDTAKASRNAAEVQIKASEDRREEIDKLSKANKKLNDRIVGDIDYELRKRQAAGKDTTKLELKKLKALIFSAKQERALQLEKTKALITEINLRLQLGDVTEEEKEKFKELADEQIKVLEDSATATRKAVQDLNVFIIGKRKENADKLTEVRKKQQEDNKKADEQDISNAKKKEDALEKIRLDGITKAKAEQDQLLEYKKLLDDAEISLIQNTFDQQEAITNQEFEEKLLALEEKNMLTNELEFALLVERNKRLGEIDKDRADKEIENSEKVKDKKLENQEKFFNGATELINTLGKINDAATGIALRNAGNDEKKKEEIRKNSFKREKALNLAMAAINGAQAVIKGFAQGGYAGAILAGVTAAANIAIIASTKFQGAGGGGGAAGGSAPSAGSFTPSSTQSNEQAPRNTDGTVLADTDGGTPTKQKVYVVSSDISDQQDTDEKVELAATV